MKIEKTEDRFRNSKKRIEALIEFKNLRERIKRDQGKFIRWRNLYEKLRDDEWRIEFVMKAPAHWLSLAATCQL